MKPNLPENLIYSYFKSPVGDILVAGDEAYVRALSFPEGKNVIKPHESWQRDDAFFPQIFAELNAYFAKDLTDFTFPFKFEGTPFQNSVWQALCEIPYGETWSYGELALRIGNPKASQAVGLANGANPLPIVVPCHRVIGANNSLTGFGGGLATKQFLLDLESRQGTLF